MKQRVGLRGRWPWSRKFCSWTSLSPRWMCSLPKTCAASCWISGWRRNSHDAAFSLSRTISKKRCCWRTASSCWGATRRRFAPIFALPLQQPRDRKSAAFVLYVDYIYKVMTQPQLKLAPPSTGRANRQKPAAANAAARAARRHRRIAGVAARPRRRRRHVSHCRGSACSKWTICCRLWMPRRCSALPRRTKAMCAITPKGKAFAQADIATQKRIVSRCGAGARFAAAADSKHAAKEIGSHHAGGIFPRPAGRAFLAKRKRSSRSKPR